MDHTQAIQEKFTERYLLGELTPAQRDQFEEHFFDCAICADDVQAGAGFVDNARALLRGGPIPEEAVASITQGAFARFGIPFQAAACAFVGLLCVVSYENIVTIPNLKTRNAAVRSSAVRGSAVRSTSVVPSEVLSTVSLVGMGSRAEEKPAVAPAAKDFELVIEIPGGPDFTGYLCEIRDQQNNLKVSRSITAAEAKDTVRLAILGAGLTVGNYQVIVLGQRAGGVSQELSQYRIAVH
jgi:Putative zinc-finger